MPRRKPSKLGLASLICSILLIVCFCISLSVRSVGADQSSPMTTGDYLIVITCVIGGVLIATLLPWYFRRQIRVINAAVAHLRNQGKIAFICAGEYGYPAYMLMTRDETSITVQRLHKGNLVAFKSYALDAVSPTIDKVEGQKAFLHDGINLHDDPEHPGRYLILPYPVRIFSSYMRGQDVEDVIERVKP